MAKKYRLPADVKAAAISYVQGYQRRRLEYKKEYNNIINSAGANYDTYWETTTDEKGKEVRVECRCYGSRPEGACGNPTEQKAFRLAMLDAKFDTKILRAVERARDLIGDRIDDDEIRNALVSGIFRNCERRQNWTFERLNLPTISRNEFFEERRRFLYHVAKFSGLIE